MTRQADRLDTALAQRSPLSLFPMRIAKTLYLISAAAGLLLGFGQEASAQGSRPVVLRFRKAGDTTVAVRNALITVDHSIEAGLTDSLGIVRIADLEDGGHIVEAVAKGYQAFFDKFVSGPNIPQPIQLDVDAVVAAAKVRGQPTELRVAEFDKRRAAGQGKFFTLAQLKAADGRPLSNLLKGNAGAFLAEGPRGESFLAAGAQPRPAAPCFAAVVRDGLRLYPFEGASPPDLDKIFTDDLAGIEIYARAALAPAELREAATCGALLLWSR